MNGRPETPNTSQCAWSVSSARSREVLEARRSESPNPGICLTLCEEVLRCLSDHFAHEECSKAEGVLDPILVTDICVDLL